MTSFRWIVICAMSLAGQMQGVVNGPLSRQAVAQERVLVEPVVEQPPAPKRSPAELALNEIMGSPGLGGITLPEGYRFVEKPGGICNVFGGIAGPDGVDISYSVWTPAPPVGEPRHSGHYDTANGAMAMYPDQCMVRYINGDRVELAVLGKRSIVVSYPNRGIDMTASMNSDERFVDALLIMLSIPNETRFLSWTDAQTILEYGAIESLRQTGTAGLNIRMNDGIEFHSEQPRMDAFIEVLKKCGRYEKETSIEGLIFEVENVHQEPLDFDRAAPSIGK